jgi:Zn-dependent membrane protease YugP
MIGILFLVVIMGAGLLAQRNVTGTFRRWSQTQSSSGRTGAEVARAILDRNGLHDVPVEPVAGELSDHYDPGKRVVRLSEPVFGSRSVSAVAVAAHEVGHAIQHKQAYAPLAIRSALFPIAAFGGSAFTPLFLVGIVLFAAGSVVGATYVMIAALALFAFNVLFQLVTLPVEFDASRRAKAQLQELTLVPAGGQEAEGAAKVLSAAALTYVVAALASVATLAYYAWMFFGNRN